MHAQLEIEEDRGLAASTSPVLWGGCNDALSSRARKKLKILRQNSKQIDDGSSGSGKSMTMSTPTPPPPPAKIIHLSKQRRPSKPIVKSPKFMASPSSIYMAICEYNSLMDALYGGVSICIDESGDNEDDAVNALHRRLAADEGVCELEYYLILINIYFGGCPIFEQTFNANLNSTRNADDTDNKDRHSTMPTSTVIERAVHQSVRHLCSHECFLRAYHPIRELSFLWRDMRVANHSGVKKHYILSGWRCRQYPRQSKNAWHSTSLESRYTIKTTSAALPLVYISPDDMEFNTKSKAINYMNTLFSTQAPTSMHEPPTKPNASTLMIDLITTMGPLYSPLGLLEELFVHDPWKLLVSTICLHVTTRAQVDKVLHNFLQRWPDVHSTANESCWEEISTIISPLGLGTKRAKGLIRFSQEYISLTEHNDPFSLTESQVKGLYSIGEYGWAAYELFILKRLPVGSVKVCDHALQLYVEYQIGRRALECRESLILE